jgi:hypothetical protein
LEQPRHLRYPQHCSIRNETEAEGSRRRKADPSKGLERNDEDMDWYSPTRRVLFALLRKQEGKAHSYVIANVQDREGNTKPFPIRAECRGGLTPGNTSGKSRRDTMDAEAGKVCAANSKDHSQDSPEWLMRETPLEKSVHRKVQRTEHREFLKQFHHGLLEVIEGRTLPRQSRISSAQSKTPSSKQPKRYRGRSGGGRRRGKKKWTR